MDVIWSIAKWILIVLGGIVSYCIFYLGLQLISMLYRGIVYCFKVPFCNSEIRKAKVNYEMAQNKLESLLLKFGIGQDANCYSITEGQLTFLYKHYSGLINVGGCIYKNQNDLDLNYEKIKTQLRMFERTQALLLKAEIKKAEIADKIWD